MAKTRKQRRILEQSTYTVEYYSGGRIFRWKGSTYEEALRRMTLVFNLGHNPEVWRESDRKCMTREFATLA